MKLGEPEISARDEKAQANDSKSTSQKKASQQPTYRPRFWTVTAVFSLIVNIILVIAVIVLLTQAFAIKSAIQKGLIDPLYDNFVRMDEARIQTTVSVDTNVPAKFDLSLDTDTTVRLSQDTFIDNANVDINTGSLTLEAPADIILPSGTNLPIHLSLTVPVDQQIPVTLTVPVNIPLNQTELHTPFVGLRDTIAPYRDLLNKIPSSWEEALCGINPAKFCAALVP